MVQSFLKSAGLGWAPRAARGLLAVALLVGLLFAASCERRQHRSGYTGDGRKEIVFLTMQLRPRFDDYFLALIAEFERTHPDVKIKWIDAPFNEYETKLMTSYIAGQEPDVINIPSEGVMEYVEKGLFLAMDDHLEDGVKESYVPSLMQDGGVYEGRVHALPWYAACNVLFVNKAIMAEAGLPSDPAPRYNEDIPGIARIVREKTGKFGYFPVYTEYGSMRTVLHEAGVPVMNEDRTQAIFNTPRGVEVVKIWTDLYRDRMVPSEAITAIHRRPIEYYKNGNLALLVNGPQFIDQIRKDSPDVYASSTVAPMLRWKHSEQYLVALHVLSVSSRTPHPALATEFAAYVTNAENQLAFCKLVTILPSVTKALEDPYFTDVEDTLEGNARKISAGQIHKSTVFRPPSDSRILFRVMDDVTEDIALGRMEADEGLRVAEEKWNAILN